MPRVVAEGKLKSEYRVHTRVRWWGPVNFHTQDAHVPDWEKHDSMHWQALVVGNCTKLVTPVMSKPNTLRWQRPSGKAQDGSCHDSTQGQTAMRRECGGACRQQRRWDWQWWWWWWWMA